MGTERSKERVRLAAPFDHHPLLFLVTTLLCEHFSFIYLFNLF